MVQSQYSEGMDTDNNSGTGTDGVKDGTTSITPAFLLSTLDKFLSFASNNEDRGNFRDNNESSDADEQSAIETSLFVLQNLPPARPAVLSYLSQILSKQVWYYMKRNEPPLPNKEDSSVNQIESLLVDLIEIAPTIWASMVARWAVDQLARWSVDWNNVMNKRENTLDEKVADWLLCSPINALANLTVTCVAHDADNTVAALLDARAQGGSALDWLVAHVGCSFPTTIVNRVLSLGLRSFANANSKNAADQQLSSINLVLVHLAERHFPEIQRGLQKVLLMTFSNSNDNTIKATIPYLLRLAGTGIGYSRAILNALSASLPKILEPQEHVNALAKQVAWWVPQYFPTTKHLTDLLVCLLLEVESSASCPLVFYLLKASHNSSALSIAGTSPANATNLPYQFLHMLLTELCRLSYGRTSSNNERRTHISLLTGLVINNEERLLDTIQLSSMNINDLIELILREENERTIRRLGQILTYLVVQQGSEVSSPILRKMLSAKVPITPNLLFLLNSVKTAIVRNQAVFNQPAKTLTSVLSYNLQSNMKSSDVLETVQKVEALWGNSRLHNVYISEALITAVSGNILNLSRLINIPHLSVSVLELVSHLPLENPIPLSHLLSLGHGTVFFFYSNLKETDLKVKLKNANLCTKVLTQLSSSSLGHSLLVRLLFEASFHQEWSYLFGAKSALKCSRDASPNHLFKTNLMFDSWVKLPQSLNTIFHAGQIKSNKFNATQKKASSLLLSKEEITLNTQLLLNLLGSFCHTQGTTQGATSIALLLVEHIVPDIMFNGFPWPEENIKFTFERDLAIQKTFEDFPIAWSYLGLVAQCRPSLCYCSVLVRGVTAALTAYWTTSPLSHSYDSPELMSSTRRLIELMVVGQFLPESFSVLPQMVGQVAPHDVVVLLQDVWAYLRDHTPSPDRWVQLSNGIHQRLWESTDNRYTDRCRNLIHAHIEKFGHLMPSVIGR